MECLESLVGIRQLCETTDPEPLFWLDDAEGLDRDTLASLAKATEGSGKQFGKNIIESASRFLMADIETIIPKGYTIKSALNAFCNTCTYTALTNASSFTGILAKNTTTSKTDYLSLDSLKVMIADSGPFNIVIDDGKNPKIIPYTFTADTEVILTNINYKTSEKSLKIYFQENPNIYALNCPTTKSCGCSGSTTNKDIQVKGLLNNVEYTTQYGFTPCLSVICSLDNVICNIVNQQPRLFGLALFYRAAARYFSEFQVTQRNNRNASFDEDEKLSLADRYINLYYERLRGSKNVKGIADNMAAALNNLNDVCVECKRITGIAWAVS